MSEPRILVIDDDEKMTHLLQVFLARHGFQISEANSGPDGLKLAQQVQPDLIILDVMMPDMNGLVTCERLRGITDVPIVMLTAKSTEKDIVGGLGKGADDYIVKPFRVGELLARIKSVLRRAQDKSQAAEIGAYAGGDLIVDFSRHQVTVRGQQIDLTSTEYDLLLCLVRNEGRTLSHAVLLAQVWGNESAESSQYLKLYIHYLRQKIEKDPGNPEYILTEWGVGYRFGGK